MIEELIYDDRFIDEQHILWWNICLVVEKQHVLHSKYNGNMSLWEINMHFDSGQTGSGKTYTMLDPKHGLYVQAAHDIFHMLGKPQYSHLSAWVGFYEIYQGQLYDLLNQRKRLTPREDGNSNVVIAGLKEFPIKDVDRLMEVFDFGSQARTTGKKICHPYGS